MYRLWSMRSKWECFCILTNRKSETNAFDWAASMNKEFFTLTTLWQEHLVCNQCKISNSLKFSSLVFTFTTCFHRVSCQRNINCKAVEQISSSIKHWKVAIKLVRWGLAGVASLSNHLFSDTCPPSKKAYLLSSLVIKLLLILCRLHPMKGLLWAKVSYFQKVSLFSSFLAWLFRLLHIIVWQHILHIRGRYCASLGL